MRLEIDREGRMGDEERGRKKIWKERKKEKGGMGKKEISK